MVEEVRVVAVVSDTVVVSNPLRIPNTRGLLTTFFTRIIAYFVLLETGVFPAQAKTTHIKSFDL